MHICKTRIIFNTNTQKCKHTLVSGLRIIAQNVLIIYHGIISSYLLGEEFLFQTTYLFLLLHPVIRHNYTLMYFSNCRYRHSHMHVSAVLVYSNHLNKVKCMNPFATKAYITACPHLPVFPLDIPKYFWWPAQGYSRN